MSRTAFQLIVLSALLATLANWHHAHAEVIVQIGNGTVTPGGTITLDVMISGTAPEDLAEYDVIFDVTSIASQAGTALELAALQNESFLLDPNYVFFGTDDGMGAPDPTASAAVFDGVPATAIASPTRLQVVDLAVDAAGDLSFVTVDTPRLLTQIELVHNLGAVDPALTVGNTFDVSLDLFLEPFFFDFDGFEINVDSSISGTVTVVAAVPEPSTAFALAAMLIVPLSIRRRKRLRC
ncbi:PEP-CTERM sorting domain-containing protein [Stieleria varia]|uniref:PEP-CTERM protein-sorting domain-containing protein n=1 Tax=Stieleria varia TaxID=2528005 RepID=A0A5C6ATW9_9BACT|nr:PEP-CTERM sorting domain-containing protein [Stieleria varia]TWU02649.1 hypothetical protein Pla52n_37060 [Stieleria varia]